MGTATKNPVVSDIMTTHLYVINLSDPLTKAKSIFEKYDVRHLPVLNDGKMVGILSLTDMRKISFGDIFLENESDSRHSLLHGLSISDVMTPHPESISENDNLIEVAKKLIEHEFHSLPVEKNGRLIGILTTTDLIEYLIEEHEECNRGKLGKFE